MASTKAEMAAVRERVLDAVRAEAGTTSEIAGRLRMQRITAVGWLRGLELDGIIISRKVKTTRVRTGVSVWALADALAELDAACERVVADKSRSTFMRYVGPPSGAGAASASTEASS